MISILLVSGFVGSVFAQQIIQLTPQEFSQEEIDEMKHKAVLIETSAGTFMIELFPEDAPNTVNNFLKLVESGYYDGIVFHRIIPGFMIQAGDPNTKNPEVDRSLWGRGGPGYQINAEFNTLQHDRGVVSMARSGHPDTAGSQFFIVHKDSNFLDGQYTAFGKLLPGTFSFRTLDTIASIRTAADKPLDVLEATIINASILDPYTTSGFAGPDRNASIIKSTKVAGGFTENYFNFLHQISFDLPYRWTIIEGTGDYLNLVLEPTFMEHNVQLQIDETGFTPQVLILSEESNPTEQDTGVSSAFFSIKEGEEHKIFSNYVFVNDDGRKFRILVTTQDVQTLTGTVQYQNHTT